MGVPKFFRYISERYPCLSEFVKEYQIPVFDNLYLDMNGIIHMCSHPDDNNPHFRITEERIFADIFHYIEFLFRMIKPQKVFFMAVDGVAPRAKMNQQRGRRFRSAREAKKMEKEALKKGEKLPEAGRFDSNCITPGTEFMARLHEHLKYFVVQKVSSDALWKKCKIILSGQETPGEGEHKIMDYIRYIRAQPGYDPNTRHCLYGLDADLIMLGLCTHDPHFSLLREEVKFGKKTKRSNVPEDIRFYLLHLSLMREYLELEFQDLKNLTTPKFNIEKIIDDWILMGFLVGNDFIPNLPNLHISNGALPVLYKVYIEVLPKLDGYINEAGTLNLERFEKFMRKLADIDFKNFEETHDDMMYLKSKTGRKHEFHTSVSSKSKNNEDEFSKTGNSDLAALIQATDELDVSSEDEVDSSEDELFKQFKDEYYRNKLEYQKVTPEVMREQAEGYVRAIQWNLHYYYNGVCSWSWFYPHHYSPYISDIKGFANLRIDFELGKPFKPYEQLLAVLPSASKNLLPKCYHHLMTDDTSKIKDYYPEDFQTDMNGKKQEWEAVVLVPFIDENLLLETMKPCNELLTDEEVKRNAHGPMLVYEYSDEDLGIYEAPSYFPKVENRARCSEVKIEDLLVPKGRLVKGAYPGAKFDVFYPGFPTFKHLNYTGAFKKARVKVFEVPSRHENMILELQPKEDDSATVRKLLGKLVWVGWPHLTEAKVVAISTKSEKFFSPEMDEKLKGKPNLFAQELEGVEEYYMNRMGINFGKTDFLVHVQLMVGRKYVFTSGTRVTLEKQFSNIISSYPYQGVVAEIKVHDQIGTTFCEVNDVFPKGTLCFSLSNPHYGSQGTVMDSEVSLTVNQIKVSLRILDEPNLTSAQEKYETLNRSYLSLANSASQLAMSNYLFSRITGSLFVSVRNGEGGFKTTNIGLDLKFTKKNQETPGYTKKVANYWMYTSKAVALVRQYIKKFPEVFKYLSNSNDDEIMADNIFEVDGDERVREIHIWLKTLPVHNLERRVCGSLVLEAEVVNEIEKATDETKENCMELVMLMKPQFLYKPEMQMGNLCPDPLTKTTIFDRVVNVREGNTVPLGLKGTVTAIYKSPNSFDNEDEMYDIVFDKPFVGGMALNCSEQRGYRLSKISFINLTYGRRLMEQKTGVTGALRALVKERNNSNYLNINLRPQSSAFASFNKAPTFNNNKPPPFNFAQQQQLNPILHTSSTGAKDSLPFVDVSKNQKTRVNKETSVHQRSVSSKTPLTAKSETRTEPVKPQNITVNTDFLKKILNIPSNLASAPKAALPPNSSFEQWRQIPNSPSTALQSQHKLNHLPNECPIPNNFHPTGQFQSNHPNMRHFEPNYPNIRQVQNSFQNVRPITKTNLSGASATLLSYYQSNLLGCPRYTYLNEDKGVCAQITLPNGQVISGPTAKNREEASDRVAEQVLAIFLNTKIDFPQRFPEPPTKWVQNKQVTSQVYLNSAQQKTNPNTHMKDAPSSSGSPRKNYAHNGKDGSNKHAFVPLQVLKKKPATLKSANKQEVQVAKKERTDSVKSVPPKIEVSKIGDLKKRDDKKRQNRRPRIAANFQM